MRAMVFDGMVKELKLSEIPIPEPNDEQILIKIKACGVCRTDLHIVDGDLREPKLPLIPGHEITGFIERCGKNVIGFKQGDKVGVPWLGFTCGECKYCKRNQENLCENAKFTGYTLNGGYAEYTIADQQYCFKIPKGYDLIEAAPLLCAGLIGYRSYRMIENEFVNMGIYGFGAAAHIITQIAVFHGKKVFAFTKNGDIKAQDFAKKLGAIWAGNSKDNPPEKLDAAIIFAPVGLLVPLALKAVDKGGSIICGGIHMSDIPSFEYKYLWEERSIKTVANLTREDGKELMKIAPLVQVKTETIKYKLEDANIALDDLRNGKLNGAAVLVV